MISSFSNNMKIEVMNYPSINPMTSTRNTWKSNRAKNSRDNLLRRNIPFRISYWHINKLKILIHCYVPYSCLTWLISGGTPSPWSGRLNVSITTLGDPWLLLLRPIPNANQLRANSQISNGFTLAFGKNYL